MKKTFFDASASDPSDKSEMSEMSDKTPSIPAQFPAFFPKIKKNAFFMVLGFA